jgi:hypothetical protein
MNSETNEERLHFAQNNDVRTPEQYHMSPNATLLMEMVAFPAQPVQVAVMVYSPPAFAGCSKAFHAGAGLFIALATAIP